MSELHITAQEAIEAFRQGQMLILVDDEERENEGDFVIPAEFATPENLNVMVKHGRGMVCVPLGEKRARELDLHPMAPINTSRFGTNFTISVDHEQTSTGISAFDRSKTILAFADPGSRPGDFRRPGHIHPIIARPGGVLQRAGHTEGVVDLCNLAGLSGAGALCEILREDGEMARMADLEKIAEALNFRICSIHDLIEHRLGREKLVERAVTTTIPNEYGEWTLHLYENKLNGDLHTALVFGKPEEADSALVRVHSQCFTGDTLGSLRCDCGSQLKTAMAHISKEGSGVLLYLQQEGRGIGLKAKLQAYVLQDQGKDTVEANQALGHKADQREYGIGAQILADLGIHRMRILTNNPHKRRGLEAFGLEIIDRVPIEVGRSKYNEAYLDTKARKMGHLLLGPDAGNSGAGNAPSAESDGR